MTSLKVFCCRAVIIRPDCSFAEADGLNELQIAFVCREVLKVHEYYQCLYRRA